MPISVAPSLASVLVKALTPASSDRATPMLMLPPNVTSANVDWDCVGLAIERSYALLATGRSLRSPDTAHDAASLLGAFVAIGGLCPRFCWSFSPLLRLDA